MRDVFLVIIILMKFVLKRELRWLIFLLVPFVCLLIIHVIVPLFFLTQSTPLLQESYNIDKKDLEFRTLYSLQQINQQIITGRLMQHYKIFEDLHYLIVQQQLELLSINPESITLNNAYKIVQDINEGRLPANYIELKSMWFAKNCSNFQDLNDMQKYTYVTYSTVVEPYIQSLVKVDNRSSLLGIKTHLSVNGTTISYHYPSQYEEQYSSINEQPFSDFDQYLINKYLAKNQSITAYLEFEKDGDAILAIATVLYDADGNPYGVSSLCFDLGKLAQELSDIINFAHSDYFQISYSIVIPMITPNQTSYVRAIKINQTGGYPITASGVPGSTIPKVLPVTSSVDDTITINGSSTTILGPLIIEDDLINQSSIIYLGSKNSYNPISLSNQATFNSQINLTIGLIVLLIALASIVSITIMKTLMNNLDEELIELSNQCGFIVEDDLKIEVPPYEGTKEIREVYERVRVINKLNKYSHPDYFAGHFIDKILSYCEAEKFLKKINYDAGALLENIGNSYFYMEEVDKTIEYYKESVRCILTKIRVEYGTIDEIFEWKQTARLPKTYREYEIILIRRLFNLIESYNCLLECHMAQDIKANENEIIKDILDYIDLFKKAVYPDFHMYAEFILVLFYQIKLRLYKNSVEIAQKILNKAETLCEIYIDSYAQISRKMKEKGSKNKLLHMKNKITSHSRMHPEKIKTFRSYFKALVLLKSDQHANKLQALRILFEGTKVGIFSNRITWMIFQKIHNILKQYGISEHKLYTLSIYNQICLLKNVKQKEFHSQSCPYRYPSQIPKSEQEYVFLVDCLTNDSSPGVESYFQNKATNIYNKFIKGVDRLSIIKFNTSQGIKIECNLTMKQSKQEILKKQIYVSFLENGSYRFLKNDLFEAFQKVIYRLMRLKSQKIVIIYFQSLLKYRNHLNYIRKKERSRIKRLNSLNIDEANRESLPTPQFRQFGDWIVTVIQECQIQQCKICFFCDEGDKLEDFRQFFGLENINRRLWKSESGLNLHNNCVYVVQRDHKMDIERILSKRVYAVPDNHIFIL